MPDSKNCREGNQKQRGKADEPLKFCVVVLQAKRSEGEHEKACGD
jgi:hypothetical protein